MDTGKWAIAALLSLGLGWLAAPASAAPAASTGAGGIRDAASESSVVEQARWYRRCWRDRWGNVRCRRAWRGGPYYYGAPYYRPGFRFYYGGGPRYHYRGHGYRRHFYGGHRFRDHGYRSHGFRGHGGHRR